MDAFTQRRLVKFIRDHRAKSGTPPTLKDLESSGFPKELIDEALKHDLLEMFYVNLTSGSTVKTYRLKQ